MIAYHKKPEDQNIRRKIMNRLNIDPRRKIPALRTLLCQALFRRGLFSVCTLACLTLSSFSRAVDPPPDGGYPNLNTAEGESALFSLTTGFDNTAIGFQALYFKHPGSSNPASGAHALALNTTRSENTANAHSALLNNPSGSSNIALGDSAGANLTIGSNNIDIGSAGVAGEANAIRIGTAGTQTATFIAGISGATVARGVAVVIDTDGHLGVKHSSARFKEAIKPMDKASEAVLSLQPVTFRYKHDLDPDGIPQFGLVAEQVEKINPDLVARDQEGKPYTVRYEAVNAMLLNEFLKEHRRVEQQAAAITEMKSSAAKQDATAARLESMLKQQQVEIAALTSQLRSVKTGVEADKASLLVAHNP